MGVFDLLRGGIRVRPDAFQGTVIDLGMRSPWAEGSLTAITASDLFGKDIADALPMGRDEALKIPAVAKARNLLVSQIARLPLRALDDRGPITEQPTWLYRSNGPVSPHSRMAVTVDDLIFYGVSLWLVERGAAGQILDARWCPPAQWKITDGFLLVNDEPVADDGFLLIDVPGFPGLLTTGDRTLKGARDTEEAWTGRMRNPIPLVELKVTDDQNLTQEEVTDYVEKWAAARRAVNGGVSFTPPGIEVRTHGEVHADLFVEARNAVRTDVASHLGLTAAILDGTIGVDSLTYSTKEGEVAIFAAMGLPFWTDAIEAALSQDRAVPRGQRIRFDRSDPHAAAPLGTITED